MVALLVWFDFITEGNGLMTTQYKISFVWDYQNTTMSDNMITCIPFPKQGLDISTSGRGEGVIRINCVTNI